MITYNKEDYLYTNIKDNKNLAIGYLLRFKAPITQAAKYNFHVRADMIELSKQNRLFTIQHIGKFFDGRININDGAGWVYHVDMFEKATLKPKKTFKADDKIRIKQFKKGEMFDGTAAYYTPNYCGQEGTLVRSSGLLTQRWITSLSSNLTFHPDMFEHCKTVKEKKSMSMLWPLDFSEKEKLSEEDKKLVVDYKPNHWRNFCGMPIDKLSNESLLAQHAWAYDSKHITQNVLKGNKSHKAVKRILRRELMKRDLWPIPKKVKT